MNDKFHLSKRENAFLAKKLVSQTIYNSAKLEGVNTTFPETEAILGGVNVAGAKLDDITIILNLRDAWRFVLNSLDQEIDLKIIEQINENVSRNESLSWGVLRDGHVGIAGTDHRPEIPVRKNVERDIREILTRDISVTERALDLMLYIMHSQLFWDGNKRTATLAANFVLIRAGAGILSVADNEIVEFNRRLNNFYNNGDRDKLKQFLYEKAITDAPHLVRDENQNVPLNVLENVPLNPTEQRVFAEITQNPHITTDEIAAKIGKTRRTISRVIATLKSRQLIVREGSDKVGRWAIK
jgi:Fic family protein